MNRSSAPRGLKLTPVRVGPLLERATSENEVAAQTKGVSLRTALTSATIESDALLLSIVPRLVSNAVKYTKPGGRILLGCCHPGHSTRIDVELVSPRISCLECSNFAHE
jgi:two-component system, OmpR family, phosphate regulon sensor histidine kinase PhoR